MTIIIAIFFLFLLLIGFVAVDVILTSRRQKSIPTIPISKSTSDGNEIRNILTKVSKERGEADEKPERDRGFTEIMDEVIRANVDWELYKTIRIKKD
ncbi:MAG: hypothetical protein HZA00_11015 [Nitrospinae bacterium]|nr:hypothetical protein [Nitrospinota bacterium]